MGTYDTRSGHPRHDLAADEDPPCDECGRPVHDCDCPECPHCGSQPCGCGAMKKILTLEALVEKFRQDFIWWCEHRRHCGWRHGECDCLLDEALKGADYGDHYEWSMERAKRERHAMGLDDPEKRAKFAEWCKERGLP